MFGLLSLLQKFKFLVSSLECYLRFATKGNLQCRDAACRVLSPLRSESGKAERLQKKGWFQLRGTPRPYM